MTSYKKFKDKISYRIHKRTGWHLSESSKIATNIVDLVKDFSGGGALWKSKFQQGSYKTSRYLTLRDFITALENISIPTNVYSTWKNRREFKELFIKFQTTNIIEALNSFVEKHSQAETISFREKFKALFTPIKNDAISLAAQAKKNFQDFIATTSISYSELKAKVETFRTPKAFLNTFFSLFGILNSVVVDNEITIGILPLGGMGIDSPTSIQSIEVSHSNKIVKYRAVGSIYLAHQVGGHDSIKISGKLQGPLRLWFLTALWIMTILSQGYWQTVDWNSDLVKIMGAGSGSLRDGIGNLLPTQKVDNIITQEPAYEKHITYPVVTEHEIIPNAYIETFSFEEKIETNKDIITYDIMMRTYTEPKEFLADNKRSVMRVAKQETMTEQVLKYTLNYTYRLIQWGKESLLHIDSNAWKVENYYDLDAYDIAFTMSLALAGVIVG